MPERTDRLADPERSADLARSWVANAGPWTRAVRDGLIASRAAGTDAAVVAAVAERRPKRVLDLGCGEGWLCRRLQAETGCRAVGIDATQALVEAARAADPDGDYRAVSFAEFVAGPDTVGGGYDVAVFNYALFDDTAGDLLAAAASVLAPGGAVIVQTLHPGDGDGGDGWRIEDFAGFGKPDEAWAPMPWFYRTRESWIALLSGAGLALADLRQPAAADGRVLSLLLVAEPAP